MRYLTLMLLFLMASCSKEKTVQSYFVEKSEQPNFVVVDIPSKSIVADDFALTEKQQAALKRFDKLNVLVFRPDALDTTVLEKETAEVKALLLASDMEELMRADFGDYNLKAYVDSNLDTFDEVIVLAGMPEKGFGLIRVMGNSMSVNDALEMVNLLEKNKNSVGELTTLFNGFI